MRKNYIRWTAVCLAGAAALSMAACGGRDGAGLNLVESQEDSGRIVNLFIHFHMQFRIIFKYSHTYYLRLVK